MKGYFQVKSKVLVFTLSIIFLIFQFGCAYGKKNIVPYNPSHFRQPESVKIDPPTSEKKILEIEPNEERNQNQEKEWLMAVLILLGIGLVTCAVIYASFSGEKGLELRIGN